MAELAQRALTLLVVAARILRAPRGAGRPRHGAHRRARGRWHRARARRPEDGRAPVRGRLAGRRPAGAGGRLLPVRQPDRHGRGDRASIDPGPHARPDAGVHPQRRVRVHADRELRQARSDLAADHAQAPVRHHVGSGAARAGARAGAPLRAPDDPSRSGAGAAGRPRALRAGAGDLRLRAHPGLQRVPGRTRGHLSSHHGHRRRRAPPASRFRRRRSTAAATGSIRTAPAPWRPRCGAGEPTARCPCRSSRRSASRSSGTRSTTPRTDRLHNSGAPRRPGAGERAAR